ncbi:DUF4115 domain-containing protein, partial [Pseudomonas aeruginosa]|nr:DUF4115 domain-containing protein [Pseudomonas aeruginosa]
RFSCRGRRERNRGAAPAGPCLQFQAVALALQRADQVTDANGKVLVSALKRKGDSLELAGKAPLELRLGFARGAQVSYNGQPVDVTPFVRGETARLKVGQ